jgi:hypothetical protein
MTLQKINNDHYVVVDESIQPVNGWYYDTNIDKIRQTNGAEYGVDKTVLQITHSTQPLESSIDNSNRFVLIKELNLSLVKSLVGEIDVEKKAEDFAKKYSIYDTAQDDTQYGFINGYNQCVEDKTLVIHKILDHLCDKMEIITQEMINKSDSQLSRYRTLKYVFDYIKSVTEPKETWEVEFDSDNNLKLK